MKVYKLTESINEDGRHVCGTNCRVIKYTLNKNVAKNFANKITCPIECRCVKTITVEEN